MQLIAKQRKIEVWAEFQPKIDAYEMYADPDGIDFIGTAETIAEAKKMARSWLSEFAE